ncbi:MAG TPA: hypothetical protein VM260_20760, partial [Pirellula sp.]|nr:hypothetical protein [Pirellula sp.]
MTQKLIIRSVIAIIAFTCPAASDSRSQDMLPSSTWPAASVERSALPKERDFTYEFKDVKIASLERLLSMARVNLPVRIAGTLSGWLWIQRAASGWLRFNDYRLEGEITSPLLTIDRWQIEQAKLRFGYVNRAWYVSTLSGDVKTLDDQQSVGKAKLAAVLNRSQMQSLEISGNFTQAKLQPFFDQFGIKIKVDNQPGTMALSGSVPWRSVDQPDMWMATAMLNLPDFKVQGAPSGTLNTTATLDKGTWIIGHGNATIGGQSLSIKGEGKVVNPFPYAIAVAGSQVNMTQLLNEFDLQQMARQIEGMISIEAKLLGNAVDGLQSASLDIASKTLKFDGESVNDIHVVAALPKDPKSQPT